MSVVDFRDGVLTLRARSPDVQWLQERMTDHAERQLAGALGEVSVEWVGENE